MDWTFATVTELDALILKFEDDQHAWQHQLEDAHRALVSAEHLADGARAAEAEARRHVHEDAAELDRLRAERAEQTIPPPRIPR